MTIKEILQLIESSMSYLNYGNNTEEIYRRAAPFCDEMIGELKKVRPKNANEKDAINFAIQQLQVRDLAGAISTLESIS